MKSVCAAAVILAAVSSLSLGSHQVAAQSPSQQSARQAKTVQSAALTPKEKEAQKHYRIALEALKNDDLATASDELTSAAELAPKNALIWYNLAVVESKKGDESTLALQHLQKANSLGLPSSVKSDAEELEAKLSYDEKREARKGAFSAKLQELQREINDVAKGGCTRDDSRQGVLRGPGEEDDEAYSYSLAPQNSPRSVTVSIKYTNNLLSESPLSYSRVASYGNASFDLADLSPNVGVVQRQTVCNNGSVTYNVVIKSNSQSTIHFAGRSTDKMNQSTPWVDGDTLIVMFPTQDSAETAAKTFSDVIRMSSEIR